MEFEKEAGSLAKLFGDAHSGDRGDVTSVSNPLEAVALTAEELNGATSFIRAAEEIALSFSEMDRLLAFNIRGAKDAIVSFQAGTFLAPDLVDGKWIHDQRFHIGLRLIDGLNKIRELAQTFDVPVGRILFPNPDAMKILGSDPAHAEFVANFCKINAVVEKIGGKGATLTEIIPPLEARKKDHLYATLRHVFRRSKTRAREFEPGGDNVKSLLEETLHALQGDRRLHYVDRIDKALSAHLDWQKTRVVDRYVAALRKVRLWVAEDANKKKAAFQNWKKRGDIKLRKGPKNLPLFEAAGSAPPSLVPHYPPIQPGDQPGIAKGRMADELRPVEVRFAAWVSQDLPKAIEAYFKLAARRFGTRKLIDLDLARQLSGEYRLGQRLNNLMPTNAPAARLTDECLDAVLAQPAGRGSSGEKSNKILYIMGVGGSGKTMLARASLRERDDEILAVFTRVSSPITHIHSIMGRILAADKDVELRLVVRKPEDLFKARFARALKTGETEPLHQVALRFGDCLLGFSYVYQQYQAKPDPAVNSGIITNFGGPKDMRLSEDPLKTIAEIRALIPNLPPLTGDRVKDGRALKIGLLQVAYATLQEYDTAHPAGKKGHLAKGPLRDAVVGSFAAGMAGVDSDVYGTLPDIELAAESVRRPATLRVASEAPRPKAD